MSKYPIKIISANIVERKLSPADMICISHLLQQLSPGKQFSLTMEDISEVTRNGIFLVAIDITKDCGIIGIATLLVGRKPTARFSELHDVVVHDSYRGRGIGRALTEYAIRLAQEVDVKFIELSSNPGRVNANLLYQSLGFAHIDSNYYRLLL